MQGNPYGSPGKAKESEMDRVARESREFRQKEADRIAAEKEAARLELERQKQLELERVAEQSGQFKEQEAKERGENPRDINRREIDLGDTNVSEKAKRLSELEKKEQEKRGLREYLGGLFRKESLSEEEVGAPSDTPTGIITDGEESIRNLSVLQTTRRTPTKVGSDGLSQISEMDSSLPQGSKQTVYYDAQSTEDSKQSLYFDSFSPAGEELRELLSGSDPYSQNLNVPRNVSASDEPDEHQNALARRGMMRSLPQRSKQKNESDTPDSLMHPPVQEAFCEVPLKYTGEGFEFIPEACVNVTTSMPPSRVNGQWSGALEGQCSIGTPTSSGTGSIVLDYDAKPGKKLSFGVIHGHEDHHPLVCLGGTLRVKNSAFGATVFHSSPFAHSLLPLESMFAMSYRKVFPNSNWLFSSELSRLQELSLALSNKKLSGRLAWSLRTPNQLSARMDARPVISDHRSGHVFAEWKLGVWQVGGSIVQSLHSRVASVGLGIRVISTRGLEWVLSWQRGDAVLRIPVVVSSGLSNVHLGKVLYFSMLSFLIEEGLAELWGWHIVKSTAESASENEVTPKAKGRKDAQIQKDLMTRQAKRKKMDEAEKDGLVIHKASYSVEGGVEWDVAVPLQFWVNQSTLNLPPKSKSQLLGFYDISANVKDDRTVVTTLHQSQPWWKPMWDDLLELPSTVVAQRAPETPIPTLSVRYDFQGQSYQIIIKDKEELILPNPRAHRV